MGPPVSTHMPMRPPPPTSAGCLPPITSLTPPPTKACPIGIGGAMGMTTGGDPGATLTLIPPPQPHPVTTTTASLPGVTTKLGVFTYYFVVPPTNLALYFWLFTCRAAARSTFDVGQKKKKKKGETLAFYCHFCLCAWNIFNWSYYMGIYGLA